MVAMRDSSGVALAVGRFTGWEPLGFEAGDNNWYRFVANEPTGKTDPTGLDWSDCMPGIRERNGMICGYSIWLLTGTCCALPNVVCERRLKSAARGGRKVQRWGWVESTPG